MNVAVIPARGGSKGVLRKNLQLVGGVPLVARAINACRGAEYIHEVIVSTEDDEIAAVASNEGATVHKRTPTLAGDSVTSEEVLLDVLKERPDVYHLAFVQCTSPFIRAEEVDACMFMLERDSYDVVFTVERIHSGIWQPLPNGEMVCVNYLAGAVRPPRQIGPVTYRETGGVYVMRRDKFEAAGSRFCGRAGVFEVSERAAIDIDNPWDLNIARAVAGNSYWKDGYRRQEDARCQTAAQSPEQWPGTHVPR